jgi:hypothetical protein
MRFVQIKSSKTDQLIIIFRFMTASSLNIKIVEYLQLESDDVAISVSDKI